MAASQPPLPDDPVLGAVVQEVADHHDQLNEQGKRLDDHQSRMMAYEVAIGEVRDDFAKLDETFQKLNKRLDEVPAVVCWVHLDNQQAVKAWAELRAWVEVVLVGRYPHLTVTGGRRMLPPCWYLHPYLVEELSALHSAWLFSFVEPGAPLTAPNDWHRRLADCRARVSEVVKCSNGHNADPPAGEPADAGFEAFVATDIDSRPDPPPAKD